MYRSLAEQRCRLLQPFSPAAALAPVLAGREVADRVGQQHLGVQRGAVEVAYRGIT